MDKPKADISVERWFDDYKDDILKTTTRLIGAGVDEDKAYKWAKESIKKMYLEAIEVSIKGD